MAQGVQETVPFLVAPKVLQAKYCLEIVQQKLSCNELVKLDQYCEGQ
jgi:hypothetical protein